MALFLFVNVSFQPHLIYDPILIPKALIEPLDNPIDL